MNHPRFFPLPIIVNKVKQLRKFKDESKVEVVELKSNLVHCAVKSTKTFSKQMHCQELEIVDKLETQTLYVKGYQYIQRAFKTSKLFLITESFLVLVKELNLKGLIPEYLYPDKNTSNIFW